MFKNNKNTKKYTYSVILEDVLESFIEFIKEITSIEKKEKLSIIDLINFSKVDTVFNERCVNIKTELYKLNKLTNKERKKRVPNTHIVNSLKAKSLIFKEQLVDQENNGLSILSTFFLNNILSSENLNSLQLQNILFIDKIQNIIVFEDSLNDKNIFFVIISRYGIVSKLIALLKVRLNEGIKDQLNIFDNWIINRESFKFELETNLKCAILNESFLDKVSIKREIMEKEDIWINQKALKKFYNITLSVSEYYLLKSDNQIIGFSADNTAFLIAKDVNKILDTNYIFKYYWILFKRNVYRKTKQTHIINHNIVIDFNKNSTIDSFTNLLSNLKKNLYIEGVKIPDEYNKFFENAISISNLDHISGFEFYLPDIREEKKTLLGIYHNDKKPSETHYNLINWITNEDEDVNLFTNDDNKKKPKKIVSILKPEISFYFRYRFFEDFFERILKDLGFDYLSNYELEYISRVGCCEIDFLINTGSKLFIVETKTKLSREYIEKFEKTCDILINEMSPIISNIEFIIVSAFSDDNCNVYKYYIEQGKKDHPGYNCNRDEIYTIPYWFEFPIANNAEKKLTCIAEPSYEKLKAIILEKCKE